MNHVEINFEVKDMTNFKYENNFDVITCYFDSVNFLQSSRHVTQTEEAKEEVNNMLKAGSNPKVMAELFNKAVKDPSLLDNLKSW